MNVMRRLKSIASGRSSVSDPSGDSNIKRVKVDQEVDWRAAAESESVDKCATAAEQNMASTSAEPAACTSSMLAKPVKSGFGARCC